MTNAEKYLKDSVSVEELTQNLTNYINKTQKPTYEKIKNFFEQKAQLLTEDERVILRNIRDNPKYIKRDGKYSLLCYDKINKNGLIDNGTILNGYGHLFQFIKERRRVRDKGVIRK
ncbi:MAG: hypothetical protein J6T10_24245 [Methanobrevibacter sp.]|nr:hypothetical protein [Methanobrevibacter sp.]